METHYVMATDSKPESLSDLWKRMRLRMGLSAMTDEDQNPESHDFTRPDSEEDGKC